MRAVREWLKMRLQITAAAVKITKTLWQQSKKIRFYYVCIRKALEGKLRKDPIPFAFTKVDSVSHV